MLKVGNRVQTKHGKGKILRIDDKTYSIILYGIKLTTGRFKGETLFQMGSEIKKIK